MKMKIKETPRKRMRTECGVGKIKSIYCRNFITYEEVTCYPNQYLNVIIGPNGTGKSTLVSAIVLCLGGEPQTLFRATDIRDFIKNGKDQAKISVEVYSNVKGDTIKFSRSFDCSGRSHYKLNQDSVSKKKYFDMIAEYKIQVTNLCQFLPQDRVQDFAKMNPQDLFMNTLKSACSDSDIEKFNKLKEIQHARKNKTKTLAEQREKLKNAMLRIEELEKTLRRFNTRQAIEQKIEICHAKKLWCEVYECQAGINEIQDDLKNAQDCFVVKKSCYMKDVALEKDINVTADKLMKKEKVKDKAVKFWTDKLNDFNSLIDTNKGLINEAKVTYEKEKNEAEGLQCQIGNETRLLDACAQDLKDAQRAVREENIDGQIQEIEKKLKEAKDKLGILVKERTEINERIESQFTPKIQSLKRRLERLENESELKMQFLKDKFPDVYTAVVWLKSNRHLFKGQIYDPMILLMNVNDPENVKYFENTINIRDLLAFTCEEKSDVSTLTDELCVKNRLQINVGYSPPATTCTYKAAEPIAKYKHLGFTSYMIDLVEGPAVPLNYLCSIYGLHMIPVGSDLVTRKTDMIPSHFRQYFGGNQKFSVSVSRYTKDVSIMQAVIEGRNLIRCVDQKEVQFIRNEYTSLLKQSDALKNERSQVHAKISELDFHYTELRQSKSNLESRRLHVGHCEHNFKKQQLKVSRLKSQQVDSESLEANFNSKVQMHLKIILESEKSRVSALNNLEKSITAYQTANSLLNIFKTENGDLLEQIKVSKSEYLDAEKTLNCVKQALELKKVKLCSKTTEALARTGGKNPNARDFQYKKEFAELPDDIEEIKAVVEDCLARLDCMGDVGRNIVQEHKSKTEEIENLKSQIRESQRNDNAYIEQIEEIYEDWYPVISQLVGSINENFSKFMCSMEYVGEVALTRQEEYDFQSYGIQILVKYRSKEPLQPLDRCRQSGGERAVAIAVYSFALQHVTNVPFRCVDEINQGMDAKNERKIFDMLVQETTQVAARSQYFFVTPKLLSGLTFNERLSIHTVYNAPFIPNYEVFNVTVYL